MSRVPLEINTALAAHYCLQTNFCNARSGNEKGTHGNPHRPAPLATTQASLRRRCTEVRRISSQTTGHDQHENLVLMGNPGTGKTHLMTAFSINAPAYSLQEMQRP
ncbi:ATP-binding protein [Selenomonas sp. oral taxon 478]|uniref:ATP-binding protein n=1 Tax=Selenomonas sp. oral taxon 478 TaxID=712538 RepID=UPI0008FFB32D|nr:ATP-binding protein [Selenomonas sp. oral taxon 478]